MAAAVILLLALRLDDLCPNAPGHDSGSVPATKENTNGLGAIKPDFEGSVRDKSTEDGGGPDATEHECSTAVLSKENVECWNELFGRMVHFKSIISYEIFDAGDGKDDLAGVLFTAVGRRTALSEGTMIVPEGYYEKTRAVNDSFPIDAEYADRVIYGFIVFDVGSGDRELKLFGGTNMFPCRSEPRRRLVSDIEGVGPICSELLPDDFPILKTQPLLSNKRFQIRYHFIPGGENVGVYDYLFLYERKTLTPVFSAWHHRSGAVRFGHFPAIPKVQYEEDRIVEYSSLHTPFEGRGHDRTFTTRSVFDWDGRKFVLKEEQVAPLQREMVDDYRIEKDALLKIQHLHQEKWRLDPIEVARRNCDRCKGFRIAFLKQGVAVVWADRATSDPARTEHVSVYLYGPFYAHEGIADRNIWSVMESEKRIPGRVGVPARAGS